MSKEDFSSLANKNIIIGLSCSMSDYLILQYYIYKYICLDLFQDLYSFYWTHEIAVSHLMQHVSFLDINNFICSHQYLHNTGQPHIVLLCHATGLHCQGQSCRNKRNTDNNKKKYIYIFYIFETSHRRQCILCTR